MPLLAIFLLHSWNRWGWMVIVRASGAVLHPSLDSLGWLLPLLAAIGIVVAASDRRARVTIVLLMVIALQALTLFAVAKAQGADTPYMAFKMAYLAIYPLAILAAYALARCRAAARAHEPMGWLIAAVLLVVAVRPALTASRSIPVVDLDLNAAGQWLRANGGAACADYLVADAETAYWLHLAVLGNPRAASGCGKSIATTRARRWRRGSQPKAGATRSLICAYCRPRSCRVQTWRQFGSAAVISRRGCYNQRL